MACERLTDPPGAGVRCTGPCCEPAGEAIRDPRVCTGHLLDIVDRARRICTSAKHQAEHPGVKARLGHFPASGLLPWAEYTLHGVQLADRGIGQGVRYHHTLTTADGAADECVCAVEELVLREERANGWEASTMPQNSSRMRRPMREIAGESPWSRSLRRVARTVGPPWHGACVRAAKRTKPGMAATHKTTHHRLRGA